MGHEARRMRGARPRRRRRGAARCGRSRRGWPGRAQSRTRPAAPRPTCGHSCSAARRPARPRRARVSRARIFAALAAPLLASSRGASRARARGRAPWHATAPEAPATLALSDTGNRETPVLPQRTPASAAQPAPAVRPAAPCCGHCARTPAALVAAPAVSPGVRGACRRTRAWLRESAMSPIGTLSAALMCLRSAATVASSGTCMRSRPSLRARKHSQCAEDRKQSSSLLNTACSAPGPQPYEHRCCRQVDTAQRLRPAAPC